jgi:cell division protease FtsH
LAVLIGGLCAERLLFGEEAKTLGSEFDLRMATQLILNALMNNGFYKSIGYFNHNADENHQALTSFGKEIDSECLRWIEDAEKLAFDTLQNNRELLLQCSWKLSEKQSLKHAELKNLFTRYAAVENREKWFDSVDDHDQYRELLRKQINSQSVEFL